MKKVRFLFGNLPAVLFFMMFVFMVASCGGGGNGGGDTADTVSPVPGGGGAVAVISEGETVIEISWIEATDDVSAPGNLEYIVYYAQVEDITSVADVENNATAYGGWEADASSREIGGLTRGMSYWFNVLVRDEAENTAAYTPVSGSTLTGAPLNRAGGIDFNDLDMGHMEAGGIVEIEKAADESDVTHYVLYWGDEYQQKLSGEDPVVTLEKTGDDLLYLLQPDTVMPNGAEYLLVFTANDLAEMEEGVSVGPVDEEGDIYANTEGTAGSPIPLTAEFPGAEYEKTIGTGKSYYYTERTNETLSVEVEDMSDDVDIICYDGDETFTEVDTELTESYGRTADELCGATSAFLYFVIDGSDTGYKLNGPGASFTLIVTSAPNSSTIPYSEGSEEEPFFIPTGYQYRGQVGTDGTSYYEAEVTPGVEYIVNVYGDSLTPIIYTDQFDTEVANPVTAAGDRLYLSVSGNETSFDVEVVYAEGEEYPVFLKTEKTNKCRVDHTSSYYVFDADDGSDYTVSAVMREGRDPDLGKDLDVFVYSDIDFSDQIGSAQTEEGTASCTVTAESGILAVRVDDETGSGGTFKLIVEEQ